MNTTTRTGRRRVAVPALAALLTTMLLVAPASAAQPDTSPATCSLLRWVKHPAMVRVADDQSGVASYTVLDSWNVSTTSSQSWSPPTASASIPWSRPGRGAGVALVTHTNGAGVRAECVLFVRRDGTATVVN